MILYQVDKSIVFEHSINMTKAHIPPETAFAMCTECKQKLGHQHKSNMPNMKHNPHLPNANFILPARDGARIGTAIVSIGSTIVHVGSMKF